MDIPTHIHSRSISTHRLKPLCCSEISNSRFFLNLREISNILRKQSVGSIPSSPIDKYWRQWTSQLISTRDLFELFDRCPCVTVKYRIDDFFRIYSKFQIFWENTVSD